MYRLSVACSPSVREYFHTERTVVNVYETDFTDVAAVVVSDQDIDIIREIDSTKFEIPIFVICRFGRELDPEIDRIIHRSFDFDEMDYNIANDEIECAADQYEYHVLPAFFEALSNYMDRNNLQFDCPGHQGGQYFRKHPAGRYFYDFYGEMMFKSDVCNADVSLGDLLIHEGMAAEAVRNAATVFNSDNTFFVLNGTSSSNLIVTSALVADGDLVLFDRNNHKSAYEGALIQGGGIPVYLETARNPFGFIGGIDDKCFDEAYIRERIAKIDPERAKADRPFRLAIIQLGTYDGSIYNARQVVDRIGKLCDYILFDSAWVGYEQFIPMMKDSSPLLLELGPDDPGIMVTQSAHKQQAGFSQTSYIHKKDSHIKGQKRYVSYEQFNIAYRAYSTTSPFYPLFACLDVNARMQGRAAGRKLWDDCIRMGIKARKDVLKKCRMFRPFIPPTVYGKPWESYEVDEIAGNIDFFRFEPGEKWHSFDNYGKNQYFVDPNKLMFTTPGIDIETGEYEDFGIPAAILANYLRDNRIIPEKNDFNDILFLMTPAETKMKLDSLIAHLVRFEKMVEDNVNMRQAVPTIYEKYHDRYRGMGVRDICQEMHDFYKSRNAKELQRKLFREAHFPEQAMLPREANNQLLRNNVKLVRLDEIEGEIAIEGALPYPPGIYVVAPGERWSKEAVEYFKILEDGINQFPGFAPEIHGVYFKQENGRSVTYAYVKE